MTSHRSDNQCTLMTFLISRTRIVLQKHLTTFQGCVSCISMTKANRIRFLKGSLKCFLLATLANNFFQNTHLATFLALLYTTTMQPIRNSDVYTTGRSKKQKPVKLIYRLSISVTKANRIQFLKQFIEELFASYKHQLITFFRRPIWLHSWHYYHNHATSQELRCIYYRQIKETETRKADLQAF